MLNFIQDLDSFKNLISDLHTDQYQSGLGIPRSARLPITAAVQQTLNWPIVYVIERMDQAISLSDELGFWVKSDLIQIFPEPTPMFYEKAAWGSLARKDRIQALTRLSQYHLPGVERPVESPIFITTVRGLMTKTIPRREFLKYIRTFNVKK